MPLLILSLDFNNQIALDVAVAKNKPNVLEMLVDMLSDFYDICLTKMMLA